MALFQHSPVELSVMVGCSINSALLNAVATDHMWILSIWSVDSVIKEMIS